MENKTNFFTLLESILGNVDLTLTFRKQDGKIVVGVRPQRSDVKDLADIRPMVLTHTSADLDESFFETITQPIQKVDTTADEIKAFNDSLEAKKKEATENKPVSSSSSSSKSKSKKPAPKPVTKKPEPVKQSPEEVAKEKEELKRLAEEKKQKEAEEKKFAVVKTHLEKSRTLIEAGDLKGALSEIKKGMNLGDGLSYAKGLIEELITLNTEVSTKLEEERVKAEQAKNMVLANTHAEQAQITCKSLNFGECGKALKEVFRLVPDHPEGLKVKQELIDKLGEGFVTKLLA